MPEIGNIIKNIQNIMRKDPGVDGDAQRLSQLVWMLFLKIVDDREEAFELEDPKYKSPVPEKLRWRNWAQDKEGMTGDKLYKFVDQELFPTLSKLPINEDKNLSSIIRNVFSDTYNYSPINIILSHIEISSALRRL